MAYCSGCWMPCSPLRLLVLPTRRAVYSYQFLRLLYPFAATVNPAQHRPVLLSTGCHITYLRWRSAESFVHSITVQWTVAVLIDVLDHP